MFSARAFVLALALGSADASYAKIAFYAPGSDVVPHNMIDLSAQGMIAFFDGETIDGGDLDMTGATLSDAGHKYQAAATMYNTGARSSQAVEYQGSVDQAPKDDKKDDYVCTADAGLNGAGAVILNEAGSGTFKSLSSTKMKIYMNNLYGANGCGTVPYQTTPAAKANYVAPFTEDACPAIADGTTVTCTGGGDTFVFTQADSVGAAKMSGRTLKGFSTGAPGKMGTGGLNEAEYLAAEEFHQSGTYGDDTVQLALNALTNDGSTFSSCTGTGLTASGAVKALCTSGTFTQGNAICKKTKDRKPVIPAGANFADQKLDCENNGGEVTDFGARDNDLNVQVAKKVAVYANAWLYTIHEFEDAIDDCKNTDISANDASVHAWDEGVAFYTGSLAGTDGIRGGSNGKMIYELANKRCGNYGTCTGAPATPDDKTTGESKVNDKLFGDFVQGQAACHFGECAKARTHLNNIVPQMTVPLVQGTLRYAYKQGETTSSGETEIGEGYAFMMSVIHRVHACDADQAKIIYDAMNLPATKLGGGHAYADVKLAFEKTYECMGITCADVGALLMADGTAYPGAEQCTDPEPAAESEGLPTWALATIIATGAVAAIFAITTLYFRQQQKIAAQKLYKSMANEAGAGNKN
jgi:hypothetical protein